MPTSRPTRDTPFAPEFDALGVAFCESRHSKSFRMDWRSERCHKLLVILEGGGKIEFVGTEETLVAPCICLIPAGSRHRLRDKKSHPLSLYAICIQPEHFLFPDLLGSLFKRPKIFVNRDICTISSHILRKALYEQRFPGPESTALRFGLLLELLTGVIRSTQEQRELTGTITSREQVRQYAECLEREFWMQTSLGDAAERLGMSRKRLSQLFREITGNSWLEHLQGLRIAHARKLLSTTDLPIKAVAFECGYQDLSHFYRVFFSKEGRAPGSFRATHSRH